MNANERVVTWLGLGVAVATLGVGYLAYRNSARVKSTPQGFVIESPQNPAAGASYSAPTYILASPPLNSGSSQQTNPGTSVAINFTNPATPVAATGAGALGTASAAGPCCGACGSSNGVTGPCNPGSANINAYGSPADAAVAMFQNLGPAITAAFNAGEQIRREQALNMYANNPTGAGVSMLTIPPAASLKTSLGVSF